MTTARGACATRAAGISPPSSSGAITLWNGSNPPARCWDSSKNGIARLGNAGSSQETHSRYTDGITESLNDRGEEFGEQRLIEALRQHRELPSQALLRSIVDDVRQFSPQEQRDDINLIPQQGQGR